MCLWLIVHSIAYCCLLQARSELGSGRAGLACGEGCTQHWCPPLPLLAGMLATMPQMGLLSVQQNAIHKLNTSCVAAAGWAITSSVAPAVREKPPVFHLEFHLTPDTCIQLDSKSCVQVQRRMLRPAARGTSTQTCSMLCLEEPASCSISATWTRTAGRR